MTICKLNFLLIKGSLLLALPLCLSVSVVNTPYGAQSGAPGIDTPIAQAANLIGAGHFQQAVDLLNRAKQDAPQDARLYFYCGMALSQSGRMPDAAAELLEAVVLAPDRLEYRVFQAHIFVQLKQMSAADAALDVFKDAQVLERLSTAWLRLLADNYYRLAETDLALRVLDLWAKSDPNNADIDLDRGQVYVLEGQPDLALKCFQESLEKSKQNAPAYFELGRILYAQNQLLPAKDALLNAVRQDPNNPEYRSKLASVNLSLGDADAAIECLTSVESAGPKVPNIYYILGRAYRKKGDMGRSDEYLAKFQQATAAERDRNDQVLAIDRPIAQAQRQLDQGHTAEARALFEKASAIDPNRWEPNAYLAEMDINSGNFDAAYPRLEKLQQINPDSAVGNFLMARYWFGKKDFRQARVYGEKVKISRPDNSELRAMLGDIYTQLGEKEKARQEYEEAVKLAPERADLRQRLEKAEGGK